MKQLVFILLAFMADPAFGQRTERSYDAACFRVGDYIVQPYDPDSLFQYDESLPGGQTCFFHAQFDHWVTFIGAHPDLYFGIGLFTKTGDQVMLQQENTTQFTGMAADIPFFSGDSLLAEHYRPLSLTGETTRLLTGKPNGAYLVTQINDIRYFALKRTPAFFGFEDREKGFLYRGVPNQLIPLWPDSIRTYTFNGYGCELAFDADRNLIITPGASRICRIEVATADREIVYERTFPVSNVPDPVLFFSGFELQNNDMNAYSEGPVSPEDRFLVHARSAPSYLLPYGYTVLSTAISLNGERSVNDGAYLSAALSRKLHTSAKSTLKIHTITVRLPDQRIETYTVEQMLYFTAKNGQIKYSRNKRLI